MCVYSDLINVWNVRVWFCLMYVSVLMVCNKKAKTLLFVPYLLSLLRCSEFKEERLRGCRADSLALRASSPCPTYCSPSPDHFLLPLKLGAPLCCCQTGYPTSCERQEGALLLAPDTSLCSSSLQQPFYSAHRHPTWKMSLWRKIKATLNTFLSISSKTT